MARPTRAEAPSVPMTIRLSPAERQFVAEAAKANHQRPCDFGRDALLSAAGDCLEVDAGPMAVVMIKIP